MKAAIDRALEDGADPNRAFEYGNRRTALHMAAAYGRTATVQRLLAAGADPAVADARGQTPADLAREKAAATGRRQFEEIVRALEPPPERARSSGPPFD